MPRSSLFAAALLITRSAAFISSPMPAFAAALRSRRAYRHLLMPNLTLYHMQLISITFCLAGIQQIHPSNVSRQTPLLLLN